jgi:hypothetical protein
LGEVAVHVNGLVKGWRGGRVVGTHDRTCWVVTSLMVRLTCGRRVTFQSLPQSILVYVCPKKYGIQEVSECNGVYIRLAS